MALGKCYCRLLGGVVSYERGTRVDPQLQTPEPEGYPQLGDSTERGFFGPARSCLN